MKRRFAFLLPLFVVWGVAGGETPLRAQTSAPAVETYVQPAGPSAPVKPKAWVWRILPGGMLGFEATQGGEPFRGSFPTFAGTIQFRPSDLGNSFVDITIQMRNMVVDGYDRNSQVRTPEWLDTFTFPTARYVATHFKDEGNDIFTAYGYLTLKGVSQPVSLRFKLVYEDVYDRTDVPKGTFPVITAKRAHLKGLATLTRSQFGIGGADGTEVGPTVKIFVALTAERPPVVE